MANLKDTMRERQTGRQALTGLETHDAVEALKIAARYGYSLERMCEIAAETLDARAVTKSCTFQKAWEALNTLMESKDVSASHLQASRYQLGVAVRMQFPDLETDLRRMEPETTRTWLNGLALSPVSKANWLRYARMVCAQAITDRYLEISPMAAVDPPNAKDAPVSYLLPAQAHMLLLHTDPRDLPYVIIGLFAGLRPHSELIDRMYEPVLNWSDIDWERLEIHVAADRTKTARHRVVPMEPALVAWLRMLGPLPNAGPIALPNIRKRLARARKRAGIAWAPDILRHTYATMWLADRGDKARLAEQMGNSTGVIDQHYRFPLSRTVAAEFWALRPTDPTELTLPAGSCCPWTPPKPKGKPGPKPRTKTST